MSEPVPAQVGDKNIAPTTTAESDLRTAGQRRVNIIWEITQAILAIIVAATALYVAAAKVLKGDSSDAAFLLLSNAFFVVISTYLARTNHTKTGGVQQGDTGR